MSYAPANKCNYNNCCMNEYNYKMGACIKNKEPDCSAQAVIPSITVETAEGITSLANCLVHVSDINTTFYIDDKHRPLITWAGPVNIPGYDMEHNPEHFKNQIITDTEAQLAVIYDNNGIGYMFGIQQGADITEAVNAKINAMVASGEFEAIVDNYLISYTESLDRRFAAYTLTTDNKLDAYTTTTDTKISQIKTTADNVSDAAVQNREPFIRTKVFAHRGCDNLAPENTIPAFEYVAKVGGYAGCETDVWRTLDGVFVISHDGTVDRMTDGTGSIDELLWSTIQNLHIDAGAYIEEYSDLRMPSLTDYLKVMKKYGLIPLIEVKPNWDTDVLEDLVEEVAANGMLYNSIFCSYYADVCVKLKQIDGNINVYYTRNGGTLSENDKTLMVNNHINAMLQVSDLTTANKEFFHKNGLKVGQFIDYGHGENVDIVVCADITRFNTKDYYFMDCPMSVWDMDQIEKYGTSFDGQITTLLRKGIDNAYYNFPNYLSALNYYLLTCYNKIPCSREYLLHYVVPAGWSVKVYKMRPGVNAHAAVDWRDSDGTEIVDVNATYNNDGFIVLQFKKTDSTQVNYRDIEDLRLNARVWLTRRTNI